MYAAWMQIYIWCNICIYFVKYYFKIVNEKTKWFYQLCGHEMFESWKAKVKNRFIIDFWPRDALLHKPLFR